MRRVGAAWLADRNASVPGGERIQVRIGVNLGEVIIDGEDRYGEGVNIAARLEQLAEPGGIWVSGKVRGEVDEEADRSLRPMGEQMVKNIVRADFRLSDCRGGNAGRAHRPGRRLVRSRIDLRWRCCRSPTSRGDAEQD